MGDLRRDRGRPDISNGLTKRHGYVFEVDSLGTRTTGEPLTALGRFAHEAVCIDPRTNIAYLTEDASRPNGLLFRFSPTDRSGRFGSYAAGGALEAARCFDSAGNPIDDLAQVTRLGERLRVEWVPVADPDATTTSIREQFPATGLTPSNFVTRSRKFEGCWWGQGTAWIKLQLQPPAGGHPGPGAERVSAGSRPRRSGLEVPAGNRTLTLVALFPLAADRETNPNVFDGPDNIVVSPYGGAFLLCEDGDGAQHVISLDPLGVPSFFANNRIVFDGEISEFTGACWSNDARFPFGSTGGKETFPRRAPRGWADRVSIGRA